jgi:putative transcriptional regulator
MTIHHHLSDETLARFAAGTLAPGLSLVVETHVAGCAACHDRLPAFEAAAAALIDDLPPIALAPDALAHTFALTERPTPAMLVRPKREAPAVLPHGLAPEPLRDHVIGRWRWIAPGVRMSWIDTPEDTSTSVVLLWAKAGTRLPKHTHNGIEFTQVLKGSYSDGFGRYGVGDILEADSDVEHRPVVDADSDCICLAAIDGKIRFNGWIGRMLRPFVGG